VVALVLIVLMVAATYTTQRQVMLRNTQTLDSQQAMIQKLMLYGVPASLTVSGFFFPIGVLFYWFTNNLWSMAQQFYILKRMPHPNAKKPGADPEAAKALAPRPGQKPVRPTKRTAQPADAAPTEDSADGTDGDSQNGKAPKPAPGARPATGAKPTPGAKPAPGARPKPAQGADSDSGQAAAAAPNGTGPADADGADGSDSAPAGPARAKPGPGARPGGGGGRRPQGQRSPTQTRQKKKRR
jgi:YidC/Oxa1 family membrane protein insertase